MGENTRNEKETCKKEEEEREIDSYYIFIDEIVLKIFLFNNKRITRSFSLIAQFLSIPYL